MDRKANVSSLGLDVSHTWEEVFHRSDAPILLLLLYVLHESLSDQVSFFT